MPPEPRTSAAKETRPENTLEKKCGGWLFLLDSLGVGGSERKTIAAANILANRGWNIHLAFLNLNYDLRNTLAPNIQTLDLDRTGKLDLLLIKRLERYIVEQEIRTVWSVNLYPMLYAFLATRNFRKGILLVGSSNVSLFRNRYERLKMTIYLPIIRRLDRFIFGSEGQMRDWKKRYLLNETHYRVIHNGVDLSRFSTARNCDQRTEARARLDIAEKSIVLGMVAQFRAEKAHGDLLHAGKTLMDSGLDIRILFVGEGPTMNETAELAENLDIGARVIFTGMTDDVRPALRAMDIFVLTSIAVETFSNAALEAMAMGLPVVLSDIGGAREMIEEGVNGYIYAPGDIDGLTSKLRNLTEPDTRLAMGAASRQIVESRFSADKMADDYEDAVN